MNYELTLTPADLAAWTHGTWHNPPAAPLRGVYTDTRAPRPGALYIALRGPNFDGNRFAAPAIAAGAAAALIADDFHDPALHTLPHLRVPDTKAALHAIAAAWRARVNPLIVGITGSAGKTTVKELTAHFLSTSGTAGTPGTAGVAKTPGNHNNDIGLPLSLLAMPPGTRTGVYEIGTNHPGEILPLARLLRPHAAILTNIGPAHIQHFGTLRAIADEKADLLRTLPPDGFCVLDQDGDFFDYLAAQTPCRIVTVSTRDPSADFFASHFDARGSVTIREKGDPAEHTLDTGLPGEHQAVNILQAVAAARTLDVPWADIHARADTLPHLPGRWETITRGDALIINDAYNANPLSMTRSLHAFAALDARGLRKLAVLGNMYELGEHAPQLHSQVGAVVAESPQIDLLLTVGDIASVHLADGARDAGMNPAHILRFATLADAKPALDALLATEPLLVLLKASRGMALERLL